MSKTPIFDATIARLAGRTLVDVPAILEGAPFPRAERTSDLTFADLATRVRALEERADDRDERERQAASFLARTRVVRSPPPPPSADLVAAVGARFGGTDTAEDRARLWQDRVDDDERSPVRGEPGTWRRLFGRLGALLSSSRGR